ncbi:hypothetical protein J6590_056349 [Homalodisca vitripennis]|nr:hypothetical protein J6590_056349 [Homalodisca vitripennis]
MDLLHRRYPLYGDSGLSVWSERFPSLPGATRAPQSGHQFRRYAGFTKPLDETLDDDPQEPKITAAILASVFLHSVHNQPW